MAKAPPISYGGTVRLASLTPVSPTPETVIPLGPQGGGGEGAYPSRRRPLESKSDPTIVYLNPEGKYELKRFALALGPKVKVHDLLIEAIEEWAERKGIAAPMRVPSERSRRRQ